MTELDLTVSQHASDPVFRLLIDCGLNTPSFISGSRAYGTPREDSDTDLCIYMPDASDREVQKRLKALADSCDGTIEYGSGRLSLKFGKLNLIIHADLPSFRAWEIGTKQLIAKSKTDIVTREEAGKLFDELEDKHINLIN